jgi:hypothetical protein
MNGNVPRVRSIWLLLAAMLTAFAACAVARACDTPVYRYAMYRWESAPYEVYHFYRGQPDKHFAEVEKILTAAAAHEVTPANVAVKQVNLEEDAELKSIPPDVAKLFQAKSDLQLPLTLVVNPLGYEVFSGALLPPVAEAGMLGNSSALRRQIGDLLKQGNAAVYVLLPGKDSEQNAAAEKALQQLVADVNSGKVQLYDGPPRDESQSNPAEETPAEPEKKKPSHSIASLTLAREVLQPQDPWLLRCLLAVEDDLARFEDEPMVFVVYGRGRALPPFIGKGITADNLVEVTEFITGACSCTVKEQNPGVDLLMAYDWKAASAAVAERFGSEEGNQESLTDLFPQLITPAKPDSPENPVSPGPLRSDEPDDDDATSSGEAGSSTPAAVAKVGEPGGPPAATNSPSGSSEPSIALATPAAATPDVAAPQPTATDTAAPAAPSPPGPNLITTLGIGLAVAVVALLAATIFIMKST